MHPLQLHPALEPNRLAELELHAAGGCAVLRLLRCACCACCDCCSAVAVGRLAGRLLLLAAVALSCSHMIASVPPGPQPGLQGVVWGSGRKSSAQTVQAITTAASYQGWGQGAAAWLLPAASMDVYKRLAKALTVLSAMPHTWPADNREFIDTKLDAFFCRKITGGNLQVRLLLPLCMLASAGLHHPPLCLDDSA